MRKYFSVRIGVQMGQNYEKTRSKNLVTLQLYHCPTQGKRSFFYKQIILSSAHVQIFYVKINRNFIKVRLLISYCCQHNCTVYCRFSFRIYMNSWFLLIDLFLVPKLPLILISNDRFFLVLSNRLFWVLFIDLLWVYIN